MELIFRDPKDAERLISEEKLVVTDYRMAPEEIEKLTNEGVIIYIDNQMSFTKDIDELVKAGSLTPRYNDSKIPPVELALLFQEDKAAYKIEIDGQEVIWNPAFDSDPRLEENENGGSKAYTSSRYDFRFHKKGKFYQSTIKQTMEMILKIIHKASSHPVLFSFGLKKIEPLVIFIHESITKEYDQNAYVFADPRLQMLHTFCRVYMSSNFQDDEGIPGRTRKLKLSNMCIDIIFNLVKEDIYYRTRLLDFLDGLRKLPDTCFKKDLFENENLRRWR